MVLLLYMYMQLYLFLHCENVDSLNQLYKAFQELSLMKSLK